MYVGSCVIQFVTGSSLSNRPETDKTGYLQNSHGSRTYWRSLRSACHLPNPHEPQAVVSNAVEFLSTLLSVRLPFLFQPFLCSHKLSNAYWHAIEQVILVLQIYFPWFFIHMPYS